MYLYKGARGAKCTRLGAAKACWGDAEESADKFKSCMCGITRSVVPEEVQTGAKELFKRALSSVSNASSNILPSCITGGYTQLGNARNPGS